jgi:anti-sigma factor RsiW
MLDRELSVGEVLRLQHHLAECAACRAVHSSESWLHSLLAAGALAEDPPAELVAQVRQRIAMEAGAGPRLLRWRRAFLPALVGGLLTAGAAVALWTHVEAAREWTAIVGDAVGDHRRYASTAGPAVLEITAADHGQLERWLQQRVGFAPRLPAEVWPGHPLLGARTAAIGGETAAHVVYAGSGGHVSLFVMARPRHRPPEQGERIVEGVEVYTQTLAGTTLSWWEGRGHLYVAASSAGDEELLELASRCLRTQQALHSHRGELDMAAESAHPRIRSALAAAA